MDEELYQTLLRRTTDDCIQMTLKAAVTIRQKCTLTEDQAKDVTLALGQMTGEIVAASLQLCIDLCREEARR